MKCGPEPRSLRGHMGPLAVGRWTEAEVKEIFRMNLLGTCLEVNDAQCEGPGAKVKNSTVSPGSF